MTGGSVGTSLMGDGTDDITASNVLDDNSVIYLNGDEESNEILFRCVTGLGPDNGNTNDDIGDLYYNNAPLNKGMCNGFLQVKGDTLADNPGVLNVLLCGNLTTSTEGVYTCRLMNSSMMYQNMSVGMYFSGRSKSHCYPGLCVSSYCCTAAPAIMNTPSSISALDVVIGSSLTLTCTSTGSPPDTFIWMKDGALITQLTSITPANYTRTSAVFHSNYTINNLSLSDNGTYTCMVANIIGGDSHNINVYVCKLFFNHK